MDQASSPVVGPTSNIPAKLKSANSFSDSPKSNSCNACHSPSQTVIGTNSQTMSPFASYSAEPKTDDPVLPKNGTKLLQSGSSTSPFIANESSPAQSNCSSPSSSSGVWLHGNNNSKRSSYKYGSNSISGDGMMTPRAGADKTAALINSDPASHALLSRSHSVNSNPGKANVNNVNASRLLCSVDSYNHSKESATNRNVINSNTFSDKNQLRYSPKTSSGYASDARLQSESPFGLPTSFESTLPGNKVKSKLRNDNNASSNMRINHLMSRTSSNNSISDLSPSSTDENNSNKLLNRSSSLALDCISTSDAFSSVCNTTSDDAKNPLNIDSSLPGPLDDDINIDSLPNDIISFDAFDFPGTANDRGDIGSNALNLSAEEIQQTLNSVSADQTLPDISLDCTTNTDPPVTDASKTDILNEKLDFDSSRVELGGILSPTSLSSSTTTSTTTTTSCVDSSKRAPTPLKSTSASYSESSSISTSALTSTHTSYASPSLSGGPTKSHLQEILGAADTNRLKNMARPIDPSQYPMSSSTTFSSNKASKPFIGQTSTMSDRMIPSMPVTSPSGVSPRHKFSSGNGPPFQSRMVHRTSSNPHPGQGLHNYDLNSGPFDHPPMMMGPKLGMPHEHPNIPSSHILHEGVPYGLSSPQGGASSWQRSHSGGGIIGPHAVQHGMNEGNRSPRGFGVTYQPRPINPMSGLQSTVDAIPTLSSMTKNNINMGPPQSSQRIPTPSLADGAMSAPLSIESRMLPPPSPLTNDKRSVSADGSVTVPGISKSKGNKRERGQSLDSKDGDKKEPGAKKRKKSKSKDESRKSEIRLNQRSAADLQNSHFHVFNTETANAAAVMVLNGSVQSLIQHHNNFQINSRLLPSKTSSIPSNPPNVIKPELASPSHVTLNSSASFPPNDRAETKQLNSSQPSSIPNHALKSDIPLSDSLPSNNPKIKTEARATDALGRFRLEVGADRPGAKLSPSNDVIKKEGQEESLTDEQRKHREESLTKIMLLKSQFLNAPNPTPANPPASSQNYSMTRHLQKVQESNKHSGSSNVEWMQLLQAYNKEKRRTRQLNSSGADGVPPEPPPYSLAGLPHPNHRWPGHAMREAHSDLPCSRFPPHGMHASIRIPQDGGRFSAPYVSNRFPRNFVPSGANHRMSMYPGANVPAGAIVPRPSMPHLPPSHAMVPSNEAYPFSEKLKEQASMYRSEGLQAIGFDSSDAVGLRMASPEWPPYTNPPGHVPLNRGVGPMPAEGLSPNCSGVASAPLNPNPIADAIEPGLVPSVDPSLDGSMTMQMNNSGMGPSFNMAPYSSKGAVNLPTFPVTSVSGAKSFPTQEIGLGANQPLDGAHTSGLMGDTMARRGETRPPDLNINSNMVRSPQNFQPGRHAMPSPGMMSSQYVPAEVGGYAQPGLPQMSPHPSNIPRSPMVNSPNLMKSPMGGMHLNVKMPHGGMGPMEQTPMIQSGPRSAGPSGGPTVEWNHAGQPSGLHSARLQHSGGNPAHKPAIQQMIDGVNRFQLPNTLYQNEVKDSVSPQTLPARMIENPALNPETHNLVQPRIEGPLTPAAASMMRHPGYDSGPRSAGPRLVGPIMGEGSEYNRPPSSHLGMCMSPGSIQGVTPQPIGQMMDHMRGAPAFISQSGVMPSSDNTANVSMHPGPNQPSNLQRYPTEFDISGMFPSDKPTETLSYFPSGGGNTQDSSQMGPAPSMSMSMRSPSMTQQSMNRYPTMGQRPLTPEATSYVGNNAGIRMPCPGNLISSNPPGYPPSGSDGYMPSSWDGMARPQMMQNSVAGMHANYQRPLI